MVIANLDQALRLSLLLYLVQSAYTLYAFLNPPEMIAAEGDAPAVPGGEDVTAILLLGTFAIVASLWIAVAWHRFALSGERVQGWLPRFHGSEILAYLGRSLLIGLLVVIGILAVSIPLGILSAGLPGLIGLMTLAIVGAAAYLFFRLGVMLPAAAIGADLRLAEAWAATRGQSGPILVLALIVVGASVLIQLPSFFNDDPSSIINLVYALVMNWFATMIGISVLTTLYGYFIEGRSID
nr:hypothetical protein [Marivita sp. GX14005]